MNVTPPHVDWHRLHGNTRYIAGNQKVSNSDGMSRRIHFYLYPTGGCDEYLSLSRFPKNESRLWRDDARNACIVSTSRRNNRITEYRVKSDQRAGLNVISRRNPFSN